MQDDKKVYVLIQASKCWRCDKDADDIEDLINGESSFAGKVIIKKEIDTVESMQNLGQYIYVHFGNTEIDPNSEPFFKFNNGHHGGTSECLFKYNTHEKGLFGGLFHEVFKPKIEELLK